MIPLSELLSGPANLPPAADGAGPADTALPGLGAFALTLDDARAALRVPGSPAHPGSGESAVPAMPPGQPQRSAGELPQAAAEATAALLARPAALNMTLEDPHSLPGAPPVVADTAVTGLPSTILPGLPQAPANEPAEPLDGAAAALPAMLSADARGPWALRLAVRATTTEGIGQGSPSGNGLPPLGPESGKALPDLPPARYQPMPAAAPAAAPAAPPAAVSAPTPAAAPAETVAAVAQAQALNLPGSPGYAQGGPLPQAPGQGTVPVAPVPAADAQPAAAAEAVSLARMAETATRAQAQLASVADMAQRAAGGETIPAERTPATAAQSASGAAAATPGLGLAQPGSVMAPVAGGAPGLSGAAPGAMPERLGAGQPQSEPVRQLGAVELRALDPTAELTTDPRRNAGGELLNHGQPGLRLDNAVPMLDAGAAAAVMDRRAIAEAAGQRRSSEQQAAAALESIDRTASTGTEASEQSSRPQTARPVVPVLQARDMSALAERMEMLVHRRGGVANVSLTLSELGDVEISVRLESKQAHVQFLVQDATARESLETQLPRLRALLGEGGIELGDVGMSMHERSGGEAGGERGEGRPGRSAHELADGAGAEESRTQRPSGDGDHLLDAFA